MSEIDWNDYLIEHDREARARTGATDRATKSEVFTRVASAKSDREDLRKELGAYEAPPPAQEVEDFSIAGAAGDIFSRLNFAAKTEPASGPSVIKIYDPRGNISRSIEPIRPADQVGAFELSSAKNQVCQNISLLETMTQFQRSTLTELEKAEDAFELHRPDGQYARDKRFQADALPNTSCYASFVVGKHNEVTYGLNSAGVPQRVYFFRPTPKPDASLAKVGRFPFNKILIELFKNCSNIEARVLLAVLCSMDAEYKVTMPRREFLTARAGFKTPEGATVDAVEKALKKLSDMPVEKFDIQYRGHLITEYALSLPSGQTISEAVASMPDQKTKRKNYKISVTANSVFGRGVFEQFNYFGIQNNFLALVTTAVDDLKQDSPKSLGRQPVIKRPSNELLVFLLMLLDRTAHGHSTWTFNVLSQARTIGLGRYVYSRHKDFVRKWFIDAYSILGRLGLLDDQYNIQDEVMRNDSVTCGGFDTVDCLRLRSRSPKARRVPAPAPALPAPAPAPA